MEDRFEPTEVNGEMCYTVKQFSHLTNRTTASVYTYLRKGNAIRKLRCVRIEDKPMIPVSELTEFPFAAPGPYGKNNPGFFDAEGKQIEKESAE